MLYVWGVARAYGARVLLRIEDHDRSRSRPEYEESIVGDMAWLGFEAANRAESPSSYRQSDSDAAYRSALEGLAKACRVYTCDCTRKQIAQRVEPNADGERPYDGRCRGRGLPLIAGSGVRVEIGEGAEEFVDELLGPQEQQPSNQSGDLLLRDRDGQWTYQFAVVVDDLRQGVDLIVRGEDLLASTGRQIRLGRMLGRETPARFVHHPLIFGADGRKLSNKTAAAPIGELRGRGAAPQQVLNEAAAAVGLTPPGASFSRDELLERIAVQLGLLQR